MIFAHAFVGAILSHFTQPKNIKKGKTGRRSILYFWISTIAGSVFPDVDVIYLALVNASVSHRYLLTHTPLPYIFVLSILLPLVWFLRIKPINIKIISGFFLGVFLHIFADSLLGKIYPLRPLSSYYFELDVFKLDESSGFILGYLKSAYFIVEVAILILGLALVIHNFRKDHQNLKILLSLFGIIELAAVISLIALL